MRTSHIALAFAGCLVIGISSFTAGRMVDSLPATTSADSPLDTRILAGSDSFSEVDQARDNLEGLSLRYVSHAQRLMLSAKRPTTPANPESPSDPSAATPEFITILEDAASGFRGTGSEIQITRHLLIALKRERLYPRWVSVYLDLAHRQPLEPMVVELAVQALDIARSTGRAREVTAALEHVAASPGPLAGREDLMRLLTRPDWAPIP